MRVAILGLGEAGRTYAEGLAATGAEVHGFDVIAPSGELVGVQTASTLPEAVAEAELVMSFVGASAAAAVANDAFSSMTDRALYADMNTAAPALMAELADGAGRVGVPFVDVAIMAPVPRAGVMTDLLASGPGARRFTELISAIGVSVNDVGPEAGAAAGLKLLRSVFMKGLAALIFESVTAADRVGSGEWMRDQIAAEFTAADESLVTRLIDGTLTHAERREHEMRDVDDYLRSLGSADWMTRGTIEWLSSLARSRREE
jgi:3-hydroxyisobutyrate dehydrogenase-like beta-hydroxyacid dehydrogenase